MCMMMLYQQIDAGAADICAGCGFDILCRQIYRQILTLEKATSRRPFQGKSAPKRKCPPNSSIEESSALTTSAGLAASLLLQILSSLGH